MRYLLCDQESVPYLRCTSSRARLKISLLIVRSPQLLDNSLANRRARQFPTSTPCILPCWRRPRGLRRCAPPATLRPSIITSACTGFSKQLQPLALRDRVATGTAPRPTPPVTTARFPLTLSASTNAQ